MGDNKLPKDTDISKADGVIKQSVLSTFSVKNPRKYLNTVTPFFSRLPAPIFSPVANSGVRPPVQDLLYMAPGYVAEGYV